MGAELVNHLWQSTLFAVAAGALTIALRRYSARTRYWVWFAVSLKFLIPFSALTALGLQLRPLTAIEIGPLPQPLLSATFHIAEPASITGSVGTLLGAGFGSLLAIVWAVGFAIVLARWLACWLRVWSLARAATPYPMNLDIEVKVSAAFPEPGVFGIRRPILLLPSTVVSRLSPAELDAIITHELCHVRNRDNLTAAVHMLVEAVFWYHPLVWWVGGELLKERERACDEAVVEGGIPPRTYAEVILNACRLCLESRLGVVAGAAGSKLKDRVEAIVHGQSARKMSHTGHASLITVALGVFILPVLTGFTMPRPDHESGPSTLPSSPQSDSTFVALSPVGSRERARLTVTPTQLSMRNMSLRKLISVACGLKESEVIGGPYWLDEHYDMEVRATSPIDRRMILTLLADRFGLRFVARNLGSSGEDPLSWSG